MEVSVVIPVGPYHAHLAQRAMQSVLSQTERCALVVSRDTERHGAGWARNQGLEQVETPYVLFLDADDWLEPDAAAVLLTAAKAAPDRYVYPDWYVGNRAVVANDCCYCLPEYSGHLVTALVPTDWLREIGGFDESLPFLEDTDLWLKLRWVGKREGLHVGKALLHYAPDGQRSAQAYYRKENFVSRTAYGDRVRDKILARYQGVTMAGCCVNRTDVLAIAPGARMPSDVLALALWRGNRSVIGKKSGRTYKGGNNRRVWVDPRDIQAAPGQWRRVS